jgi:hypothetical protein
MEVLRNYGLQVCLWSAESGHLLSLFFLPFWPPIAKVEDQFDWSPEFTGHGSFVRFVFDFYFFLYFGSDLKRSTQDYSMDPRYSLPRKPIASSIHSVGFPSFLTLEGAWVAKCQGLDST